MLKNIMAKSDRLIGLVFSYQNTLSSCTSNVLHTHARRHSYTTLARSILATLLLLMGGSIPDLEPSSSETNLDAMLTNVLMLVVYTITLVLPASVCATTAYYFFHPRQR